MADYQEPWKLLERNQKLRDGREVVDIASNTGASPENWDVVGVKVVRDLAERAVLAVNACKGIPSEALEEGRLEAMLREAGPLADWLWPFVERGEQLGNLDMRVALAFCASVRAVVGAKAPEESNGRS